MVTLPGGTLVGKLLKQKLETMRIPQVTFEGVTIEDLVSYAKSVQG